MQGSRQFDRHLVRLVIWERGDFKLGHFFLSLSSTIWLKHEIAIDDHPHGKSRPDRERRLNVEIAASDLLAGLIERIRRP